MGCGMNDIKKRFEEQMRMKSQTEKYLDSLPVTPAMGWENLSQLLARAQQERRSIDYYNADGKFKLHIGKQPKRHQPRCGAKTRIGTPCKMRVVEGKRRCRLHGGLSTGPRTPAGRARIAASNRRRAKAKILS